MSEQLALHNKLIDIQQRLKVPKDKRNEYSTSKFMYRNLEAIEEAVKPMLKEHELTLTFYDNVVAVGDRVFVKATAYLTDGKDSIEVSAFAQHATDKKGMDDAQLTGSCSSYARKYAAGGLFLIDETKDADSMDNSNQKPNATPKWVPPKDKAVTDQQKIFIANLLRQKGVESKEAIQEYLADTYGILPEAFMSQADAQMIIDDFKEDKK